MNAVGIDVSKGKSMVAVMRPFGEVVFSPFEVSHTDKDLTDLAKKLKSLSGETRVVMEHTGYYQHRSPSHSMRPAFMSQQSMQCWCMTTETTPYAEPRPKRRTPSSWRTMPWIIGSLFPGISLPETPGSC